MEEQEQEDHEEEKLVSESSRLWDLIHSPHLDSPLITHHLSPSDTQTQFKSCSISLVKDDSRSIIFPPINHEGLHLSSPTPSPSLPNHHDNNNNPQEVPKSPYSSCQENGLLWVPHPPSGTRLEVARWMAIGFELLRSRVTSTASLFRNLAGFGGVNWSLCSAARVAVLVWWLCVVVRRRRTRNSRVRRESRDQLIRIVKEKDEKINELLHQIAQMNQLLLALHRDSLPGTGGVTK